MNQMMSDKAQTKTEEDPKNKICPIHKMEIILVNLNSQEQDKFLCLKCVTYRISANQTLLSITECQDLVQTTKQQQFELQKQHFEKQIERYTQLKELLKKSVLKLQSQIKQQVDILENQMKQLQMPSDQELSEEDVKQLSKYYMGDYKIEISEINDDDQAHQEFVELIKRQFKKIQQQKEHQDILQQLDSMLSSSEKEQKQLDQTQKKIDSQKTSSLSIYCSKHNKELIMVSLEPNEEERLLSKALQTIEDATFFTIQ